MDWMAAAAALNLTPDEARHLTFQKLGASYRAAMRGNHPDQGGSHERAIKINAAREVLREWMKAGKPVPKPEPPPAAPAPEPPEPAPKPAPEPEPEPSPLDARGYVRAFALSGVLAVAVLAGVLAVSNRQLDRPAVAATVQARPTLSPQPPEDIWEMNRRLHKPNKCVEWNTFRQCTRMVYDVWRD